MRLGVRVGGVVLVTVLAVGGPAVGAVAAPAAPAGPSVSKFAPFCTKLGLAVRDLVNFGRVTTPGAILAARTRTNRDLVSAARAAPDHITAHEVRQERGDFDALVSLALADPHSTRPGTATGIARLTARGRSDAALLGNRAAHLGCAPYLRH